MFNLSCNTLQFVLFCSPKVTSDVSEQCLYLNVGKGTAAAIQHSNDCSQAHGIVCEKPMADYKVGCYATPATEINQAGATAINSTGSEAQCRQACGERPFFTTSSDQCTCLETWPLGGKGYYCKDNCTTQSNNVLLSRVIA